MTDSMEIKDQNEEMEVVVTVEESNPNEQEATFVEHLEELTTIQKDLSEIKTYINAIIDAMIKNQSFFTRVAVVWGKMPLWLKIGAGILFVAPSLVVGIVLQLAIPYVVSALCLALFAVSSYVLNNHHTNVQQVTDKLKETMGGLADILEQTIESFHLLRDQIATEIEYFQQENDRLTLKITELSEQVQLFSNHLESLQKTQKELQARGTDLESLKQSFQESVQNYEDLLAINHFELEQISKEMDQNQIDLTTKIAELNNVKNEMGEELTKLQAIITVNQSVIDTYLTQITKLDLVDEDSADHIKSKLDNFFTEKEGSFKIVAQRIYEAERELAQIKEELNQSLRKKQLLLERGEKAIELQAKAAPGNRNITNEDTPQAPKNAEALMKFGLLAIDSENTQLDYNHVTLMHY